MFVVRKFEVLAISVISIDPGCLAEDTEIPLIVDDHELAFKTLPDRSIVPAPPRVVELLPDGLKFWRPADLTINFENLSADSELFILHGSYDRDQTFLSNIVGPS